MTKKGETAAVSVLHGDSGDIWQLFPLHCGEFHAGPQPPGQVRTGVYCDSHGAFAFFLILDRAEKGQKDQWMLWLLLGAAVTAACLCTTLGTMLMCLLLGVTGLCSALAYRRLGLAVKTALCCAPALVYAALYFVVE